MIPARAYASTAIGGQYGSAVECAVETLGVSWGSLTADQQSYLFNVTTSTENMDQFAVFRNSLHEFTPSSGLGGNAYYSTLEGSMYAVVATNARRQLEEYLQAASNGGGGSSGGGSETGELVETVGGVSIYRAYRSSVQTNEIITYANGQGRKVSSLQANIFNDATYKNKLMYYNGDSGSKPNYTEIIQYNDDCQIVYHRVTNSNWYFGIVSDARVSFKQNNDTHYTARDSNIAGYLGVSSSKYVYLIKLETAKTFNRYELVNTSGGSGGTGGDEPDEPVVQPVNPTGPNVTGPTINISTGGNNSTTTTADLTPILEMLRIINDNVIVINDNLTSFSDWFGDAWGNYVDWLQLWFERFGLSLDNIYAQQELVGQNIVNELREIEDVLWYIFYKPDPEYPTPAAYDDSAVLAKLQEIIDYLGGFETDYEPDIDDGNTAGEQLAADVSSLKAKFPFCMPFELHALLALLQAPMEIPVFTVTLPMWGTLTFDMAQWSDSLAICRACSILWVIGGLLTLTSKMISYFGMPSLGGD